ncbi:GGDEF domain-containing protein [Ruminococcus sp.]|uniref:GGDEF domain-containing protein n=1 Tax=Ruminococcus sp. TaxID=41978 RepID=UPI0025F163C8|nr:GGDEF domain-containing protein [Ruminococcus sp.]
MFKDIVQMSYLIIITDITLFLFLMFNSTLSVKRKSKFMLCTLLSFIMVICNIIVYSLNDAGGHILLMKIVSAISFSISGTVTLPFIFVTDVLKKQIRRMIECLALFNVVLCITSIFNGCVFRFDSEGNRILGPLAAVPYVFSFIYITVLLITAIIKFRLGFKHESVFILTLTVGIVMAVIMNAVFHYKFLISGMASLSCTFYYMFYTTETLSRDALTDAFNRHSFYNDIKNMSKKQMYVISIDLNGLKPINDTYGHDAGDKAILAVADSAGEILPVRCRFYRMGGDEFEVLFPNSTYTEVELTVQKLKEDVHKKGYSIAAGFCEFKKGMKLDDVLREVDAIMYEDKASMKAAS